MRVELEGKVAVLTLDRPAKRNALSEEFVAEIFNALEEAEASGCDAGVLQAEGAVFCAGADREGVRWYTREKSAGSTVKIGAIELIHRIYASRIPWVAAVQGPALGAGVSLICSCVSAFGTPEAWLSVPEVEYGLFPEYLLGLLTPLMGRRRAFDLAASGRRIAAEEAVRVGLLSGLGSSETEVRRLARERAEAIASEPRFAAAAARWWRNAD